MLNPFQKSKLYIKKPTFEKQKGKPDIIATFTHFYPHAQLKKSHKATLSLCPIHGENNPSFAMYEDTNTYYCFSCNATGDSYKLIMELENIDFKDAIDYAKRNELYSQIP